jgi:hypothetical protein
VVRSQLTCRAQSGAILSLATGVIVGPVALNWVNPVEWTRGEEAVYDELVLQFTRLIIGIQVCVRSGRRRRLG